MMIAIGLARIAAYPCVAWVVLLAWHSTNCFGQEIDPTKAAKVISGKWYDSESQSYVVPHASDNYDNSLRKDGRLAVPAKPSNWEWPDINLRWIGPLVKYVIISILAILAAVAIGLLITHLSRSFRPITRTESEAAISIDPTRIEELPFEEMQATGDPLTVAKSLAQQGKFDEAIVYLYGYQLLALDHARLIYLSKGKTNRMYSRELTPQIQLREVLEATVEKFEHVYFGKHQLTKSSFIEAWSKLDTFHRCLKSVSTQPNSSGESFDLPVEAAS